MLSVLKAHEWNTNILERFILSGEWIDEIHPLIIALPEKILGDMFLLLVWRNVVFWRCFNYFFNAAGISLWKQ